MCVVKASTLRAAAVALALAGTPLAARADDPATFVSIGPLYYSSSTFINKSGQTEPSSCNFQKTGEAIYVQQRLDAADSLRLSTEYDTISCGGPSTRGLYDIEVDYLHGVSSASHPTEFSIEGSVVIPTGYSIAANPRLGLGRPGAELGSVYYSTFKAGSLAGYVTAGVNVRAYTGYPAPQLLTNVTAGLNLTSRLLAYESFYGTTHLGAGGTLLNVGTNPTVNASYDAYYISENLAYAFTPRTSLALTYQTLAGGWNTGIGSTVQASVWLRF
jgi:hypothetical protein